ncbi:ATP-dependent DNA helicase DinG [Mesobacillus harenae]|uniref:ATP-dependent DNA helicase DinG n=1 Tax=Mesobacillus harenae TaxID=2213203 RepID=UPI001580C22F|nr:ATP-dependent DNA helicase DinG [Mesobacillus harenae]
MSNKFVVVDLETTGNSPKRGDRIIQFAAVVIEDGKITNQFSSLINPEQEIPAFIEELTGISADMVQDAPLFSMIAPQVSNLLEGAYFVAHNVFFDLSFLQEELIEAGLEGFYGPVLDTVELSRIMLPTADSYKLSDLAANMGLTHERPHQADSDAYVTAELLQILLGQIGALPFVTIKSLARLSDGLKSDIHLLFEDIVSEKEKTIEVLPDGIEVYRSLALRQAIWVENSTKEDAQLDYPESDEAKEKYLKRAFPTFENRQGQFIMMDMVLDVFNKHKHALIEAGTGVGKSIAYLVPAVYFAKQNNIPVIISTYTTQLQEQLLAKDIPILKKILGFPVSTVLLKGRGHYLSLPRFEQSLREEDDNYDTTLSKMQILVWLTETQIGDSDELNLSSGGMIFWNKVKNDETSFLENKAWHSRDFYLKAKKASEDADLIITNHSLLLTDIVAKQPILPSYDFAVIDEGHHLERAAGRLFGKSLDYLGVRLLFNQLGLFEQGQLFSKLEQLVEKVDGNHDQLEHSFVLNKLIGDIQHEADDFFRMVTMVVKSNKQQQRKTGISKVHLRLAKQEGRVWKGLEASAERFSFLLKDLIAAFEKRLAYLERFSPNLPSEKKAVLEDLALLIKEIGEMRQTLRSMIFNQEKDFVTWVELDFRAAQNATTLYAQPVSVASYLHEHFFSKKKSVVLTSATLSVNGNFDFVQKGLGLDLAECDTDIIPSPFDYSRQVQLIVPEDLPDIKSVREEEFTAAITEHIISIAEATKGRMLILFTSHDMLKKTYELIRESGFLEDYALIAQGITGGSRSRLTRNFQRFEKAILFGTSSFWEGIDIPGEDLSCLIIVRLPFSSPEEPIAEAKSDMINAKGGNPFTEFALPEAILRFKQGFGRLIRTSDDKGLVVVFDRRILTTSYGKEFINSVPSIPVRKYSIDEIVKTIETWL